MDGRYAMTPDEEDRRARALLAHLPAREPSLAFRRRLLAATRTAWPQPHRARQFAGMRSELAVSAGVLIGAAGLTLAPVALVVVAFFLDAGVVVKGLARGVVALVEWVSAGLSLWDLTARAASAAGTALVSPTGTLLIVAGVLTASLALAGLSRVLPGEQGEL
jgi:hypothetical protein